MVVSELTPISLIGASPPAYDVHAEKSAHGSVTEPIDGNQVETEHPVASTGVTEGHQDGQQDGQHWARRFFAYMKTREFWITLALGQALALANTGSSTFTNLMARGGNNIPAFQTFFVYVSLNIVYTGFTLYKYGFKKWLQIVWRDGWRYIILAFFDVEGNYFIVLAYNYTTLLSAELFGFWTVVCVVLISCIVLKVRYHLTQYLGILVACGGLGLLIASDYLRGANYPGENLVKGDGFALLSSTLYAVDNVFQEFLVSKRPMYEVVGQLAFWGMLINGVQAAIFNRTQFQMATWNSAIGGYLAGYTIMLFIFYTLAPIMFRISSAVFFNISMLTMNFWGLIIGIQVFHYQVYWLYPIAFVLIVLGLFVYFMMEGFLGEARKPWLGENQEAGVDGIGTSKRAQAVGHAIV